MIKTARDFAARETTMIPTREEVNAYELSGDGSPFTFDFNINAMHARPFLELGWDKMRWNEVIIEHLVKEAIAVAEEEEGLGEPNEYWLRGRFWNLLDTAGQNYRTTKKQYRGDLNRLETDDERDERVELTILAILGRNAGRSGKVRVSLVPNYYKIDPPSFSSTSLSLLRNGFDARRLCEGPLE